MVTDSQQQTEKTEDGKIYLHEVVETSLSAQLGPCEFFEVDVEKCRKLSMRFLGLGPSDSAAGELAELISVEYGHIVEVKNRMLSDIAFDVITGSFKSVDSRILLRQITLIRPERKVKLRFSSGRTSWLNTITKPDTKPSDGQPTSKGLSNCEMLEERSSRYKKKKQRVAAAAAKTVADDDIANLIANVGNAALTEENRGKLNPGKSISNMVNKWEEKETETKVVIYESDSDSDESIFTSKIQRAEEGLGVVLPVQREQTSCWRRLFCCCCVSSGKRRLSSVVPLSDSYSRPTLREGKASERLWLPYTGNLIQLQRTVKAFQATYNTDTG